jgi:hypothetical protein
MSYCLAFSTTFGTMPMVSSVRCKEYLENTIT